MRLRVGAMSAACCLLTIMPVLHPALAAGLELRCSRAGAVFTSGERAAFVLSGTSGLVTFSLQDARYTPLRQWEQPVSSPKPVTVEVETKKLARLGLYHLNASSQGQAVSASFAMVPRRKELPETAESRLGATVVPPADPAQIPEIVHGLKLSGLQCVRMEIPQAYLIPWPQGLPRDPSAAGHDAFDTLVRALRNERLSIVLCFHGQPESTLIRPSKDAAAGNPANSPGFDLSRWAASVRAVVNHYDGLCDSWEVEGTPVSVQDRADQDSEFISATCRAIRSMQPQAAIAIPDARESSAPSPLTASNVIRVRRVVAPQPAGISIAGDPESGSVPPNTTSVWDTVSPGTAVGLRSVQSDRGVQPTAASPIPSLTAWYVESLAGGAARVLGWGWNTGGETALVNADWSPRDGLVEYRVMTDQMEGATFVRSVKLNPDVSALEFLRQIKPGDPPDRFLVAWTNTPGHKVTVRMTASGDVTLTDVQGNTTTAAEEAGTVTLNFSDRPIYVHGLDEDCWIVQ